MCKSVCVMYAVLICVASAVRVFMFMVIFLVAIKGDVYAAVDICF